MLLGRPGWREDTELCAELLQVPPEASPKVAISIRALHPDFPCPIPKYPSRLHCSPLTPESPFFPPPHSQEGLS